MIIRRAVLRVSGTKSARLSRAMGLHGPYATVILYADNVVTLYVERGTAIRTE